eukprot:CAMPEP_0172909438 /NCGR_PEP_ID=MMETSP1075-20121228/182685_1 /TAXON_ID=2916 /ORGANISM="Ceratium fusus, Strain PA161109" /LENGTH=43 /DNA_ID= /DNA_START= /DNA_END= /DNA_ORIENTATION=
MVIVCTARQQQHSFTHALHCSIPLGRFLADDKERAATTSNVGS